MPIYEYHCGTCGEDFEALQKFSDDPLTTCECGKAGRVERKLSLSAFQLKGDGWYKDLYSGGSKSNGDNGKAEGNGADAKTEGKSEGKAEPKADGKAEAKSESKADSTKTHKSGETKSSGGASGGSAGAGA